MGPSFVDLFCGAGGFTQGLKQAGWHHLLGIESDPIAASTYASNHEGRVLQKDVHHVTEQDVPEEEVDLVACSPPCQSFSMAGKRKPGDARDNLWEQALRIAVLLCKAKWIVMENVPGLLSKKAEDDHKTPIMHLIRKKLRELGYHSEYRVLNAADYGVPQARKRVFLVARRGFLTFGFPWPIPTHPKQIRSEPTPHIRFPEETTVRSILENREPAQSYFLPAKTEAYFRRRLTERPCYVKVLTDLDKPAPTIRACYHGHRGQSALLPVEESLRMLTERECARIQTFPEDYVFRTRQEGKVGPIYHQIGNAVPVRLAEAMGRALMTFFLSGS